MRRGSNQRASRTSQGKTLYVRIPEPEFEDVCERYTDLIGEAIEKLGLDIETVVFHASAAGPAPRVREDGGFAPQPSHSPNAPQAAPGSSHAPLAPGPEQARFDWSSASQLNPRYQFDAFVIGSGNQFAAAASQGRRRAAFARPTTRCSCMAAWAWARRT